MAMKQVTIRFDRDVYRFISRASTLSESSIAEFVRVAACARAAFTLAEQDPELHAHWRRLYAAAERQLEQLNGD